MFAQVPAAQQYCQFGRIKPMAAYLCVTGQTKTLYFPDRSLPTLRAVIHSRSSHGNTPSSPTSHSRPMANTYCTANCQRPEPGSVLYVSDLKSTSIRPGL